MGMAEDAVNSEESLRPCYIRLSRSSETFRNLQRRDSEAVGSGNLPCLKFS